METTGMITMTISLADYKQVGIVRGCERLPGAHSSWTGLLDECWNRS